MKYEEREYIICLELVDQPENLSAQLKHGDIPYSFTEYDFNHKLEKGVIPESVENLSLYHGYNIPITNSLPSSLNTLEFGNEYSQILKPGDLPNGIEVLKLGDQFNQSLLNIIPKTVTCLEFGFNFDQKLDNGIPPNLKTFILGAEFNQCLSTYSIPKSVTSLTFSSKFNKHIQSHHLHNNIKKIIIWKFFQPTIGRYGPDNT
ncbi:hypothetical protein ACTFIU_010930 [Dictyostelium citrinum]